MITVIICLTIFNIFFYYFYSKIIKIFNVFDYPDKNRKRQKEKVPITGGLLIFFNYILLILLNEFFQLGLFNYLDISNFDFIATFIVVPSIFYLIGLYDDKYDLNPYSKFLISIFLFYIIIQLNNNFLIDKIIINNLNIDISIIKSSIFLTILCYLLFQHAFNMFDGINLQIGFYSLFFLIFLFYLTKISFFLLLILPILFFLVLNFKNQSYMGDSGCYFISYLISINCVFFYNNEKISSEEIFLLMMIPGIDMLRLFIQRLYKKKSPFSPDRHHLHHYLTLKLSYLWANLISMTLIIFPMILYLIFHKFVTTAIFTILIYLIVFYLIIKKS